MPTKSVRISIDRELLARIDHDPRTQQQGRSAFIRDAVERYLTTKRRVDVNRQIAAAYGDKLRPLVETETWLAEQAWPEE